MRVFELAKTLGIPTKELMSLLSKLQIKVPTHMASIDEAAISKIKAALKPPKPAKSSTGKTVKTVAAAPKKLVMDSPRQESWRVARVAKPVVPPVAKPVAPPVVKSVVPPVARPVPPPVVKLVVPPATKPTMKPPISPVTKPMVPSVLKPAVPAAPKPLVPAAAPSAPAASPETPVTVAAALEPPPLKPLALKVPLTVKELADKLAISPSEIIKRLLGMKILVTINQLLTEETVEKLLKPYGYQYQRVMTTEERVEASHDLEDKTKLRPRPPVVTLMGHVDHGKTSLLDAIRETRVVEGEAGGITQHIGAYRVMLPKGTITFLDTPGHEAFTAMRARGANVTDIVVLVVAADDGMMPQTEEAVDHAKAAEATLVVALNKMDKPSANPEKVKKQLMEHELLPEEWGGKTIVVPVSAKTGEGIDQLLESILLEAEVLELKADPGRPARGVVLEGEITKGGGPVAHVLVQNGTLRVGDAVVSGMAWGKVRALLDARGHRLDEAGPSTPVELLGLSGVPKAGDTFLIVPDEKQAREIALSRKEQMREEKEPVRRAVTLEEFHKQMEAGKLKSLNLILKADVQGSVEAIRESLDKIPSDQASLKFLHVGVGAVNESDILLAEASAAVVIGFNVQLTPEAEALAKAEQVDVRLYRIIYEAVNDVRAALEGLLEPKLVEQVLGKAKVLQVFKVSKVGTIAGCQVVKGKIVRGVMARVYRGQEKLHQGKLDTLKRFKDDVREVTEGVQCGLSVTGFNDFQPDDIVEAIEVQQVAQKL